MTESIRNPSRDIEKRVRFQTLMAMAEGIYYPAALKQSFEVYFERTK